MITILENEVSDFINDKSVLITGGTGSLGNELVRLILKNFTPKRLIVLSRDEFKQYNMQQKFPSSTYPCMRYFIGDVRDYDRLDYAFKGVDVVYHAAALKQVPPLEYNPTEAIKTNIYGAENIIKAAIKHNVGRVMAISTDKATAPVNLYGATKMVMERAFVSANCLAGSDGTIFSVARYGNVFGSRGSVIPVFLKQKESGVVTITDRRMTRFTITLENAAIFVLNALRYMVGGEVFVPKIPSYTITQLATVIAPDCEQKVIGIRPGEKLHESMVGFGEAHMTLDCDKFMVITPFVKDMLGINYEDVYKEFNPVYLEGSKEYISNENEYISDEHLKKLVDEYTSS